jgi:hypothetical protein
MHLQELIDWLGRSLPGLTGAMIAGLVAIICLIGGLSLAHRTRKQLWPDDELAVPESIYSVSTTDDPFTFSRLYRSLRRLTNWWGVNALASAVLLVLTVLFATVALAPLADQAQWIVAGSAVFLIGGGAGVAELVSRYKDNPFRAVRTLPAAFYILLNAFGSLAALYLIYVYRAKLGFADDQGKWLEDSGTLVQAVMLAGFSSLLFFRTALFKFRVGDSDLSIGPSIFLDTLQGAADRAVDRVMAKPRADFVHDLMRDISFEKASVILPGHCIALMQNLSNEESQGINRVVSGLRNDKEMPDKMKALNLGLALLTVVGEKVLWTAVDGLRDDLQDSTAKLLKEVADVMNEVSFDRARKMLPDYCFALWSKPIPQEQQDKFRDDAKALSLLPEVPEEYKALLLGIRLARLTDGATLRKAVEDLTIAIRIPPALPSPST